jgi:ABC-type lipoprotein export system ATPase subunit
MLVAEHIGYTYPNSNRGLRPPGVSLVARPGEITVLRGDSGSGKSTLLACLAGVLTPTSGELSIDRRIITHAPAHDLAPARMLVLQNSGLFERLPIWQNVAIAWGWPGSKVRSRAYEHLEILGIGDLADQLPSKLSLGQRQRAAIATATACDPRVILADEPTGSLDAGNSDKVARLLRKVADQDRIVIVASHDERVLRIADATVELAAEEAP